MGKRRLSLLVLYAVSLGMLGLFTICATALRGPSPTEPLLLAAVCIFEPMLETLQPRPIDDASCMTIAKLRCSSPPSPYSPAPTAAGSTTQAKRAQMATALCMVAGWVALPARTTPGRPPPYAHVVGGLRFGSRRDDERVQAARLSSA